MKSPDKSATRPPMLFLRRSVTIQACVPGLFEIVSARAASTGTSRSYSCADQRCGKRAIHERIYPTTFVT